MKKINAFQMKIFALILMLMNHLWFAFPKVFPIWFHPLSRVVAPIFTFLVVEGFFHTRSRNIILDYLDGQHLCKQEI